MDFINIAGQTWKGRKDLCWCVGKVKAGSGGDFLNRCRCR